MGIEKEKSAFHGLPISGDDLLLRQENARLEDEAARLRAELSARQAVIDELQAFNNELLQQRGQLEDRFYRLARINESLVQASDAAHGSRANLLQRVTSALGEPLKRIEALAREALFNSKAGQNSALIELHRLCAVALRAIENIMSFSLLDAGNIELVEEQFDLGGMLAGCFGRCRSLCEEKGVSLNIIAASNLPAIVSGDSARIAEILDNLIGNSLKWTNSGGSIFVSVAIESVLERRVTLLFSVTDDGEGIAPEAQPRVVEPFYQGSSAKSEESALGLGLSISCLLVQLMGGRMWFKSGPGLGTTFNFTVAVEDGYAHLEEAASIALPSEESQRGGIEAAELPALFRPLRILLAEDSAVNQRLVTSILQQRGHEVEVAENGAEALAKYQEAGFDLIITDVQMPEMDGFEFAAAVREFEKETGRHTPIVASTIRNMKGDRELCLESGMDAYLSKPIHAAELIRIVESFSDYPVLTEN